MAYFIFLHSALHMIGKRSSVISFCWIRKYWNLKKNIRSGQCLEKDRSRFTEGWSELRRNVSVEDSSAPGINKIWLKHLDRRYQWREQSDSSRSLPRQAPRMHGKRIQSKVDIGYPCLHRSLYLRVELKPRPNMNGLLPVSITTPMTIQNGFVWWASVIESTPYGSIWKNEERSRERKIYHRRLIHSSYCLSSSEAFKWIESCWAGTERKTGWNGWREVDEFE